MKRASDRGIGFSRYRTAKEGQKGHTKCQQLREIRREKEEKKTCILKGERAPLQYEMPVDRLLRRSGFIYS